LPAASLAGVKKAGWGTPSFAGMYRGTALHVFPGTLVVMIAGAPIGDSNEIKIPCVIAAVNCRRAINLFPEYLSGFL
jgi:hypothetical protein